MAMSGFSFFRIIVLVACMTLASIGVRAAVVYSSVGTFTGNLSGGNFFTDFQSESSGNQGTSKNYSGGTPNFAFTLSPGIGNDLWTLVPSGNYPAGRAMSTQVAGDNILITFTSGNVTAVGANFSLTSASEDAVVSTFDLTVTYSDTTSESFNNISSATSNPLTFRGFTTDGSLRITSLQFHPDSQFATLDNLYVGQVTPVPELPSTGIAASLFCLIAGGWLTVKSKRWGFPSVS